MSMPETVTKLHNVFVKKDVFQTPPSKQFFVTRNFGEFIKEDGTLVQSPTTDIDDFYFATMEEATVAAARFIMKEMSKPKTKIAKVRLEIEYDPNENFSDPRGWDFNSLLNPSHARAKNKITVISIEDKN